MAREQTFVMLKPDAVARGLIGDVVGKIERKGLKVRAMRLEWAAPDVVARHYEVHKARPFYKGLVAYIQSGPVVPMVVEGEGAIKAMRALLGATNPADGRPGEIRFDFAVHIGRNLVHASDGADTASFEIGLWFPELPKAYPRTDDAWLVE